MQVEITVRGVEDAAALRDLAQAKFAAALERFRRRIRRANIRLEDETGPNQHGIDKLCAIELQLTRGEVRIREVGKDFPAVIDVAIDRMRAALGRQVSRSKRGIGEG